MDERDRILRTLRSVQSFFEAYLARIQAMDESQVVQALQAWAATRSSQRDMLAFLHSVSFVPDDTEVELNQLRSQLNSAARSNDSPFYFSDHIEEALKTRLEELRKKGQ